MYVCIYKGGPKTGPRTATFNDLFLKNYIYILLPSTIQISQVVSNQVKFSLCLIKLHTKKTYYEEWRYNSTHA
jgi:hypothetical protein